MPLGENARKAVFCSINATPQHRVGLNKTDRFSKTLSNHAQSGIALNRTKT